MSKTAANSNVVISQLTSSQDFVVHLYVYEGSTICPIRHKEEVKVNRVNKIVEDDVTITFSHFDNIVGYFSKQNVICYVAV